jgi:hypothetical protein
LAAQLGGQTLVGFESGQQKIDCLLREREFLQAPQDDPKQHVVHVFCLSWISTCCTGRSQSVEANQAGGLTDS